MQDFITLLAYISMEPAVGDGTHDKKQLKTVVTHRVRRDARSVARKRSRIQSGGVAGLGAEPHLNERSCEFGQNRQNHSL